MFIVLNLHRENLRQMMQKGRVNHSVRMQVLQMLKSQVCGEFALHGDIKDFLAHTKSYTLTCRNDISYAKRIVI